MRAGRFGTLLLAALGFVVFAANADAGREHRPLPPGPINEVMIGEPFGSAVCQLGSAGAPANVADLIRTPDDFYYILLDPADCGACLSPDTVRIESVGLLLSYDVPCTMPVRVALIDINGLTCITPCGYPCPNDAGVIWGPVQQDLVGTPGLNEFTIDIPGNVTITSRAFLRFEFYQDGIGCVRPNLVFGPSQICPRCEAFNLTLIPPHDDMCDPASAPDGLPIMFANVASCATPALPTSWGSVKAIYRQP